MAAPAVVVNRARRFYFTRPAVSGLRRADFPVLDRAVAVSAFALLLGLYVALPSLRVAGVPVRGVASLTVLIFFLVSYPAAAETALRKYLPVITLAAGFAVLGIFISLLNQASVDMIVQSVTEIHLQIIVLMFVAGMLAEIAGPRACMLAIVGVIGTSAFFAVLQVLGFDFAWELRRTLGPFAKEELRPTIIDRRPTGLSYSPIQLATQLCLAFAAFLAVRERERLRRLRAQTVDPALLLALLVLFAGSVATATRSPILGGMVFIAFYVAVHRRSWLPVAFGLGAVLIYLAWPLVLSAVQSNAPRLLRVDDNSASTRLVFAFYGIRLFLANPLGYGLTFQPSDMWVAYWPELYMMQGSSGAQKNALHNYALSMLNIYGIGILLLAPLAASLLRRAGPYLIFFVPYAVHIMFHNSGPFFSDTIIWFVIAAIAAGNRTPDHTKSDSYSSHPQCATAALRVPGSVALSHSGFERPA